MNKTEFQRHYKKFADSYDKLRDKRNQTTLTNSKRQIDYVLTQFSGIKNITEIGCGTGKFTIPLALSGKIIKAYDFSTEMLNIAEKKAFEAGVQDKIEFIHGDIENLRIKSNSSDGVLSIAVLRHFGNQSKAIGELARILSSGGIIICDYMSNSYFSLFDFIKIIFGKRTNIKGKEWFINYYRTYKEMDFELEKHGLMIEAKKGFVLIPTNITNLLRIRKVVKYVEDLTGLGGIVFLTAKKTQKMYFFLFDNFCFEVSSNKQKDFDYLKKEFPKFKKETNVNAVFTVKLSSKLPHLANYESVDNDQYLINDNSIYRPRDMIIVNNSYFINLFEGKIELTIPKGILSQRYHLLRMIYPLLRFYAAKKQVILIKGSCTSFNGHAHLCIGLSGTGKTTFVLNNLKSGHKYISDTHSIISHSGIVHPLNNCLHIFARNYKYLKFSIPKYNSYSSETWDILFRYLLFKITKKSLSKIITLPDTSIENKATELCDITILGYPNSSLLKRDKKKILANSILSINHSECFEFNRLLDIMQFIGMNKYQNYWKILEKNYNMFAEKYNNVVLFGEKGQSPL